MKKKKLIKKLNLRKKGVSNLSSINGGIVANPVNIKTNEARCFSRKDTCLCMTYDECNSSETACPV